MATSTGTLASLLAPGLRKVYYDRLKDLPNEWTQIFNVETSKRAYEEDQVIAGLGLAQQKPEGQSIIYADPQEGGRVRYTHTSWGLGFRVTKEMYDDDLYGVMKKMARSLARAAEKRIEYIAFSVLNNAWDPNFAGADGQPLCSTAHPLVKGGTYANTPAIQADLSVAALQAACINFENTPDEEGIIVGIKPKLLVVGPDNRFIAREILGSDYKPYTSDNEINALKDLDLQVVVVHYLTDPDAWYLLAPKGEHDLNFFWRYKPDFKEADDFDTRDAKFSTFFRCSVGFTDWRGVYGSQGA